MNDFLLKFDKLETIRVTEGSFSSVLVTAVGDVMLTRADAVTSATLPWGDSSLQEWPAFYDLNFYNIGIESDFIVPNVYTMSNGRNGLKMQQLNKFWYLVNAESVIK